MKKSVRVALVGAKGQMGHAIISAAKDHPNIDIVLACDVGDSIDDKITESNVIVDFSNASAIGEVCRVATQYRTPAVIGTTGHSPEQKEMIHAAGKEVAIVYASNFSVGVNVLFAVTSKAAELLGNFDARISETHHTKKKDAPSGTAKTLAEAIKASRKPQRDIPIESIREGEVVGDHTVFFDGPGERLELTHRASNREIFARGALRAAEWVVGKPSGVYSMRDVLGL
jgi:4-hydroxy-tetrahydrodipicolinate reductase